MRIATGPGRTGTAPGRPAHAAGVLLALAALLLGSVFAGATPAAAHAVLTGSSPAEKSVVDTAPEQVALTFSEDVTLSDGALRVLGPDGDRVDTGTVRDGDTRQSTGLGGGLPDGTYTVAWQAVSADSHPISGAFTFSVGAPSKTAPAVTGPDTGSGLVGVLYGIGRYAAYAGFMLLVGGAAFALLHGGRRAEPVLQRLVVTGWTTTAAATLVMLLLRNPYTGSGELSDTFDLGGLREVLATKPGTALVARLLLLGAAALLVPHLFGTSARRDGTRWGTAAGGAAVATGLAATWALSEHASTGIQTALAVPADIVHLLAAAGWTGGLAAMLTLLVRSPLLPRDTVRRFSQCAFWYVAALAATGVYQSWRQVGSWAALTGTAYGQLLLVKVGLVVLLLAAARLSRRWTARMATAPEPGSAPVAADPETPPEPQPQTADPVRAAQLRRQRAAADTARRRKARDADPRRAGLRRSVLCEAAVAAAVLVATTALTGTEPGRTAEGARATDPSAASSGHRHGGAVTIPFDTGGPHGKGTARLHLAPGRTGENTVHLTATGPDGAPLDAPEVKVALTLPAKDIGPLSVTPRPVDGEKGHWRSAGVQLPLPGAWKAAVTIRTSDIDQVTEVRTVHIG